METTARIGATLEFWNGKEEQLLPDDETRLGIDYLQMKSDHQEMDRLASNLIRLFNDKGSLHDAKITAETTEALNNNVVKFKNWCRVTLGTSSRTPSVTSARSSIRSSVHSSASSAERKRNAAADAAAAKARIIIIIKIASRATRYTDIRLQPSQYKGIYTHKIFEIIIFHLTFRYSRLVFRGSCHTC